jgi:hypothetical protein
VRIIVVRIFGDASEDQANLDRYGPRLSLPH